ncbi:MAG: MG2 domain-containing protein [Caldilineaceae bacterium]
MQRQVHNINVPAIGLHKLPYQSQAMNRFHSALLILFCLLITWIVSGCQTQLTTSPLLVQPLTSHSILRPDSAYSFRFQVLTRATTQPAPYQIATAQLTWENGAVFQLFAGTTDADGQLTFTYQTPYRQPAGQATLTIELQSTEGESRYQSQVDLLPSLALLPKQQVTEIAPGGTLALDLQLYDFVHDRRVAAAPVQAQLVLANQERIDLLQGESDAQGQVTLLAPLPYDLPRGSVQLIMDAQAEVGEAHLQRQLTVVPPVTLTPLHAPKELYAGATLTYTLRVYDHVNDEAAPFSDVQIYLSGGDYEWGTPLFDGQTDADGQVSFPVTAPTNTYATQLYLDARAQALEGEAGYRQSIAVIPTVSLSVLGLADRLTPGTPTELYLHVWNNLLDRPAVAANVTASLMTSSGGFQQNIQGVTDEEGLFAFTFTPPADVQEDWLTITLNAVTAVGESSMNTGVRIASNYSLLITTDKPLYQPGQTIHLRVLALDMTTNAAVAQQPVTVAVYDSRGNNLLQQALTTSAFGIVSTDIELDSQAASGDYRITAAMSNAYGQHSVEVKPYKLPRLKVELAQDASYYAPGATATGELQADYFFGKPVADAQVVLRGYAPSAPNSKAEEQLFKVTGRTDAQGRYAYTLPLPTTLAGRLQNKTSSVRLEVDVIDGADHLEQIDATITLAETPLLLEAVAEAGWLKPAIANYIYLHATTPDGNIPADPTTTALEIQWNDNQTTWLPITLDTYGLATVTVTPTTASDQVLRIRYGAGADRYQATIKLPVEQQKGPSLLLRPANAEVPAGGELKLDLWVAGDQRQLRQPLAFVELVKAEQVIQSTAVPLVAGHGQLVMPLDPKLVGTVLVRAYLPLENHGRSSDQRLVLVNPTPVQVDIHADAPSYRPGDTAHLTISATHNGAPLQGVVGVSIVDESLFALEMQEPGFARTFFLLDRELLAARYGIHDFPDFGNESSPYDDYRSHNAARYRTVTPVLLERLPALAQARKLALLGWMAQELSSNTPESNASAAMSPPATTLSTQPLPNLLSFVLFAAIGLCGYGCRRKLPPYFVALLMVSLTSFLWLACAPAPAAAPGAADAATDSPSASNQSANTADTSAAPRLRQFFPETLLWLPAQATDAQGQTTIDVPLADSITTWRVSVLVSDPAGNLGAAQSDLRVFQDFFIEPQAPAQLTQGDRLDVPVNIYNYLDHAQTITLTVTPAAWFSLAEDSAAMVVTIGANDVTVAYLPLQISGVGSGSLQLMAQGEQMSDAVQQMVTVIYNGEAQQQIQSGRLTDSLTLPLTLPATTITGTRQVTFKLYPSLLSQVQASLAGLLERPAGNLEAIAGKSYVNVLLLQLLQQSGLPATDSQRSQAERLAWQGYQRLLAYELDTEPGGFSAYGNSPARPVLSAFVLSQLVEMSKVRAVDPQLIGRITNFLNQAQLPDGSWPADEVRYYGGWDPRSVRLATTAYLALALSESGYPNEAAYGYLRKAALNDKSDSYLSALVINALLTAPDEVTQTQGRQWLRELAANHATTQGLAYWPSALPTLLSNGDTTADLETTALVAYALLRTGEQPDLAQSALDYLLRRRTADGAFPTTQSTVLALRTLVQAALQEQPHRTATVTVRLDGQAIRQFTLDSTALTSAEVPLTGLPPTATLEIMVDGEIDAPYQLVSEYVLPWTEVAALTSTQSLDQPRAIQVAYDRTQLQVNELVTLRATLALTTTQQPSALIAAIGLPPGFTPLQADLDQLARNRNVGAYAVRQNQLLLYLTRLRTKRDYTFTLRLQARTAGLIQTPPTLLYNAYTPTRRSVDPPQTLQIVTKP